MQKTSRLMKCATACGSCPRSRSAWATDANDAATRSVSDCRVSPGRSRSGSENAHFSRSRVDASARSSSSNSCVRLTLFVQLVRIRNRTMSETISSGGFSSASEYCRSWSKAASRFARFPLYSQAKWWRSMIIPISTREVELSYSNVSYGMYAPKSNSSTALAITWDGMPA